MSKSKVSVVIPAYNAAKTLARTIESVRRQTFGDHEVIVVDDGSSDETQELIGRYPDVRYFHQDKSGAAAARNRGIQESRGEFVAFLDSDDEWLPEKLQKQVDLLEQFPDVGLVATGGYWAVGPAFPGDSQAVTRAAPRGRDRPRVRRVDFRRLLKHNFINGCTAMARRNVFDIVGGFDERLSCAEDYDLWLRICSRYKALVIQEVLACFHYSPFSLSRDIARNIQAEKSILAKWNPMNEAYSGSERISVRYYNEVLQWWYLKHAYKWLLMGHWREAREVLAEIGSLRPANHLLTLVARTGLHWPGGLEFLGRMAQRKYGSELSTRHIAKRGPE